MMLAGRAKLIREQRGCLLDWVGLCAQVEKLLDKKKASPEQVANVRKLLRRTVKVLM